jgi:hypothetical protein
MAERKSFLLRIEQALWGDLVAWAEADLRSVNGQIEFLLRQAVEKRKRAALAEAPAAEETASAEPEPSDDSSVGETGTEATETDISLL